MRSAAVKVVLESRQGTPDTVGECCAELATLADVSKQIGDCHASGFFEQPLCGQGAPEA